MATPASTTATTTELAAKPEAYLGLNGFGWVGVAFLIFAALLIYLKVPGAVTGALDKRSARIRGELDEAKRLRAEAEALLGQYTERAAQADRDAAGIIARAHEEAARIAEAARAEAQARVERRAKQAEDRIAAAERAAEADLRAQAARLAVAAARRVIAEDTGTDVQTRLTNGAIDEVGRRLV